jgi:hypothetical protein
MGNPEQQARQEIDRMLVAAGWAVQDFKAANLQAARGVALREFELNPGCGTASESQVSYMRIGTAPSAPSARLFVHALAFTLATWRCSCRRPPTGAKSQRKPSG